MKAKHLLISFVILFFCTISYAAQNEIPGVPVVNQDAYPESGTCGVVVSTEVIAYWATHGYPDLMDGQPSGAVPDTSGVITDLFYDLMVYVNWQGRVYPRDMQDGLEDYTADRGYYFEIQRSGKGRASWSAVKAEIDAGRPVILLNWDWYHYLVIIGYFDEGGHREMTVLWGHWPYVREIDADAVRVSQIETVFVIPLEPVEPSPPPADPSDQPWYEDVMQWCEENGWELEPED